MRLNCGEDNGVHLAGRTSQSIARIDRTVGNTAISRDFVRAVLSRVSTAMGWIPTATVNTARGSTVWKGAVLQGFLPDNGHRGRCGRYFTSSFPIVCMAG
jgi:hypothetical protein